MSIFDEERKKASFNTTELSHLIYGSQGLYEQFLKMQRVIGRDPALKFNPAYLGRSRKETMLHSAKKLIRYTELFPQTNMNHANKNFFFQDNAPLLLHSMMFVPTLRNLCDEEQVKQFLVPAQRGEIIGAYAQTELAHGSDVQSLMTEAVYDPQTESFILNTPSAGAAKWWVGELGVYCTHAALFAQLVTNGKRHGVHAFIVPIRDLNHKPYPGVEVGDIGPKMGFNTKDNGFLFFHNYRIPRKMMLMKYHRVSKTGEYTKVGDDKITYATMLGVRAAIPYSCFCKSAMAATIITRYSLARRQFKDNQGDDMAILDYQLQQEKVIPRIAEVFGFMFAVRNTYELSEKVVADAKRGEFGQLNEAHVVTSAIKSNCTKDALKGADIMRRAAGGHGFHMFSALPSIQLELTPNFTLQGDYTIMKLQVARFLLKNYQRLLTGKPLDSTVEYFNRAQNTPFSVDSEDRDLLMHPHTLLRIFEQNCLERTKKAAAQLQAAVSEGMDPKQAWNEKSGLQLVEAGTAYGYQWMVANYFQGIEDRKPQLSLRKVLQRLATLYAVDKLLEYSSSFFETEVVSSSSLKTYRLIRQELIESLRPEALAIVESFGFGEDVLCSAIATPDGKVYEKLLDWARNHNDINRADIREDIRKHTLETTNKLRQLMANAVPKL